MGDDAFAGRHVFLFSDLLVVVQRIKKDKKSRKKFQFVCEMARPRCEICDITDGALENGTYPCMSETWGVCHVVSISDRHVTGVSLILPSQGKQVKNAFLLCARNQRMTLCANNENEKKSWMQSLSNCISHFSSLSTVENRTCAQHPLANPNPTSLMI